MSCLMQGIFLLQKNVSVLANYVQTVLCYSNIIKGNVIPKTNNETEDFTMKIAVTYDNGNVFQQNV